MKKQLLSAVLLSTAIFANGQVQQLGTPISWKEKVNVPKNSITMTPVDNTVEAQIEADRRANSYEKNLRFGKELTTNINFMSEATVTNLPNGKVLRQLTISSPTALSINVIFTEFNLSKNAVMYLFDGDKTEFIGAHTSLNNNPNRVMGTDLIHDDKITIELVEPADEAGTSDLTIGTVVHGYLDLEEEAKALGSSGDCEYDVNCPIGAGWENQRNSVAMMVNGGGFCTGSLINNLSGTIIPYFLSANHCGTSPGSWVFRFRWERTAANAICATTNNNTNNGPTTMNVNGGTLKANCANSDFTLTLLNTAPDPAWGVYYNGFNATNTAATSACGIHHPAGDIKKISFENTPLISTTFGSCPPNSHWGVTSWDDGVTEGGSSGSPLFDENHRTVGQLHGGASVCGGSQLSDEYGKLYTSWTCGGTPSTQLVDWLDPNNTGTTIADGVDPAGPGSANDAGMSTPQGTTGTVCSTTVTPSVTIVNNGSDPLTSATVHYGYDGNLNQTYNWSGSLNQYQNEVISLPAATLSGGAHTFSAYVTDPNGVADENNLNDTITTSFTTIVNPYTVDLSLTTDRYGDECTWTVTNTANSTTFYSGGPYAEVQGGATYTASFCLAEGCYHFNIMDSYGDGLTSSGSNNGHLELTESGDLIGELAAADANFGTSHTITFCVGTNGVEEMVDLQESGSLYPNPADNVVSFGFVNDNLEKEVVIYTAQGGAVKSLKTSGVSESVSVGGLAPGIYFVTMTSEKGASTKSLVIK